MYNDNDVDYKISDYKDLSVENAYHIEHKIKNKKGVRMLFYLKNVTYLLFLFSPVKKESILMVPLKIELNNCFTNMPKKKSCILKRTHVRL